MNKIIATLLLGFLVLGGCTSTTINEFRQAPIELSDQDSVVILGRRQSGQHETEPFLIDCIAKELDALGKNVQIIGEIDFINRLYPWFEPRTAPAQTKHLPKLMDNPGVIEKIADQKVRYIIWLDGDTERVAGGGSLSCAAGPGGGGCFGFAWWQNDADYQASVWDLSDLESAGTVTTDVSGTSFLPALVIPIPLIARTQTKACKALAGQLQLFIGSGDESV